MLDRMSGFALASPCALALLGLPALPLAPAARLGDPLFAVELALHRADLAQVWFLCGDGDEPSIRTFDAGLREGARRAATDWPGGGIAPATDGTLSLGVWGGRTLRLDAAGRLQMQAQFWESPPRVEWGPGWATVELRVARPLTALQWRRVAETGAAQAVAFRSDRFDGIRQRAHLRGLTPGEEIEILLPDALPSFPPSAPKWERFRVPEVDPAGSRPTSAWPAS